MKKQTTSIGSQQSINLQKFLNGPGSNSVANHNSSTSHLPQNTSSLLSPFSLKTQVSTRNQQTKNQHTKNSISDQQFSLFTSQHLLSQNHSASVRNIETLSTLSPLRDPAAFGISSPYTNQFTGIQSQKSILTIGDQARNFSSESLRASQNKQKSIQQVNVKHFEKEKGGTQNEFQKSIGSRYTQLTQASICRKQQRYNTDSFQIQALQGDEGHQQSLIENMSRDQASQDMIDKQHHQRDQQNSKSQSNQGHHQSVSAGRRAIKQKIQSAVFSQNSKNGVINNNSNLNTQRNPFNSKTLNVLQEETCSNYNKVGSFSNLQGKFSPIKLDQIKENHELEGYEDNSNFFGEQVLVNKQSESLQAQKINQQKKSNNQKPGKINKVSLMPEMSPILKQAYEYNPCKISRVNQQPTQNRNKQALTVAQSVSCSRKVVKQEPQVRSLSPSQRNPINQSILKNRPAEDLSQKPINKWLLREKMLQQNDIINDAISNIYPISLSDSTTKNQVSTKGVDNSSIETRFNILIKEMENLKSHHNQEMQDLKKKVLETERRFLMLWEHLKDNNSKNDQKFKQMMSLIASKPTTVSHSGIESRKSHSREQSKSVRRGSSFKKAKVDEVISPQLKPIMMEHIQQRGRQHANQRITNSFVTPLHTQDSEPFMKPYELTESYLSNQSHQDQLKSFKNQPSLDHNTSQTPLYQQMNKSSTDLLSSYFAKSNNLGIANQVASTVQSPYLEIEEEIQQMRQMEGVENLDGALNYKTQLAKNFSVSSIKQTQPHKQSAYQTITSFSPVLSDNQSIASKGMTESQSQGQLQTVIVKSDQLSRNFYHFQGLTSIENKGSNVKLLHRPSDFSNDSFKTQNDQASDIYPMVSAQSIQMVDNHMRSQLNFILPEHGSSIAPSSRNILDRHLKSTQVIDQKLPDSNLIYNQARGKVFNSIQTAKQENFQHQQIKSDPGRKNFSPTSDQEHLQSQTVSIDECSQFIINLHKTQHSQDSNTLKQSTQVNSIDDPRRDQFILSQIVNKIQNEGTGEGKTKYSESFERQFPQLAKLERQYLQNIDDLCRVNKADKDRKDLEKVVEGVKIHNFQDINEGEYYMINSKWFINWFQAIRSDNLSSLSQRRVNNKDCLAPNDDTQIRKNALLNLDYFIINKQTWEYIKANYEIDYELQMKNKKLKIQRFINSANAFQVNDIQCDYLSQKSPNSIFKHSSIILDVPNELSYQMPIMNDHKEKDTIDTERKQFRYDQDRNISSCSNRGSSIKVKQKQGKDKLMKVTAQQMKFQTLK